MENHENYNTKKWIPYFKRNNSIYKKYPFIAWSITIIGIVVALWAFIHFGNEASKNASYNAGYRDSYKSIYQK